MITRRDAIKAATGLVVATVAPPGLKPEPREIPDLSTRLDAMYFATSVANLMQEELRDTEKFLVGGLRSDGEIVEIETVAYELQWWYCGFLLKPNFNLHLVRQVFLLPIAKALANVFLEQANLEKVVSSRLAPAPPSTGCRSDCNRDDTLRIRCCLSYQFQPDLEGTVIMFDGLFGSQMLGTPDSARRLMSLRQHEGMFSQNTLPTVIPERAEHLFPVVDGHWSGQTLVSADH